MLAVDIELKGIVRLERNILVKNQLNPIFGVMGKIKSFLLQEIDARPLGILRIIIGCWFLIDMLTMLITGRVTRAYVTSQVNFPFYGFEWIQPLPGWGMYFLFGLLTVASIGILIGKYYRTCTLIFLIGFTYAFMCDIPYTLNKYYLFLIFAFILAFLPADRVLSIRVFQKPKEAFSKVPRWTIFIFQFFLGFIYTLSGLSKLNPDWIFHAEPLNTFFRRRPYFADLNDETYRLLVFGFSFGGMLFDLSIIWLLRSNKTRLSGNLIQASFHSLNFFILQIGSLSIFTALISWLLFPTKWLSRQIERIPLNQNTKGHFQTPSATKYVLPIFILVQCVLPFRHSITDNNVNWTEKGHRFSWRLMTRTKSGSTSFFTISDNQSDEKWEINPLQYLTTRQYRKMSAETDLIIVFAHYLEKEWKKKGYDDVKITASVKTKLNGRPRGYLIDPELDLTRVSRSIFSDKISFPIPKRKD